VIASFHRVGAARVWGGNRYVAFFLRHVTRRLAGGQCHPTALPGAKRYDVEMSMIPDLPPKKWTALSFVPISERAGMR
jgi:hypothetical protein